MEEENEQTIVINDLLSFLSCKIKVTPREKLLKTMRLYYTDEAIVEAQKTLLASLPEKKSTRHGRRVKNPDTLIAIYECIQLIPEEDLPVFVCRNLNNIPHLDIVKLEPQEEEIETLSLKEEQRTMKSQIADIAFVVKQLRDQLDNISQQPSPVRGEGSGVKRKRNVETPPKSPEPDNTPKIKGLAYLQKLIDEDEEKNKYGLNDKDLNDKDVESDFEGEDDDEEEDEEDEDDDEDEAYDEEFTEYLDDENFADFACEVILKEEDSGSFKSKTKQIRNNIFVASPPGGPQARCIRGVENSGNKSRGQKVLYIKNEEENLPIDINIKSESDYLKNETENSIEITSASDYLGNLEDMDPSSRIFLEVCGDGSMNLMECPKITNHASKFGPIKKIIKKPKLWCCLCGSFFESTDQLVEHVSYHEKGSQLNCCKCDYNSKEPRDMRKHLVTKHAEFYGKELKRGFRCIQCNFKTKMKRRMEIHVDRHFEKKNDKCYECEICHKMYLTHANLRKHSRVHAGVRPFACKICGKRFVYGYYLTNHMQVHNDIKPFHCSICPAQFVNKMRCVRHEKMHAGEEINK